MVKFVQEWNLTLTIRHGKVLIEGPFNTFVYIADRWTLNKINLLKKTRNHLMPFPVGMRCLWESSIRSTLRETFRDLLETSQKRWLFCDVFKTSQIHLKKDVFCVTSLRRLNNISKKNSFPERPQKYLSLASICDFSKIPHKNDFVWFP